MYTSGKTCVGVTLDHCLNSAWQNNSESWQGREPEKKLDRFGYPINNYEYYYSEQNTYYSECRQYQNHSHSRTNDYDQRNYHSNVTHGYNSYLPISQSNGQNQIDLRYKLQRKAAQNEREEYIKPIHRLRSRRKDNYLEKKDSKRERQTVALQEVPMANLYQDCKRTTHGREKNNSERTHSRISPTSEKAMIHSTNLDNYLEEGEYREERYVVDLQEVPMANLYQDCKRTTHGREKNSEIKYSRLSPTSEKAMIHSTHLDNYLEEGESREERYVVDLQEVPMANLYQNYRNTTAHEREKTSDRRYSRFSATPEREILHHTHLDKMPSSSSSRRYQVDDTSKHQKSHYVEDKRSKSGSKRSNNIHERSSKITDMNKLECPRRARNISHSNKSPDLKSKHSNSRQKYKSKSQSLIPAVLNKSVSDHNALETNVTNEDTSSEHSNSTIGGANSHKLLNPNSARIEQSISGTPTYVAEHESCLDLQENTEHSEVAKLRPIILQPSPKPRASNEDTRNKCLAHNYNGLLQENRTSADINDVRSTEPSLNDCKETTIKDFRGKNNLEALCGNMGEDETMEGLSEKLLAAPFENLGENETDPPSLHSCENDDSKCVEIFEHVQEISPDFNQELRSASEQTTPEIQITCESKSETIGRGRNRCKLIKLDEFRDYCLLGHPFSLRQCLIDLKTRTWEFYCKKCRVRYEIKPSFPLNAG